VIFDVDNSSQKAISTPINLSIIKTWMLSIAILNELWKNREEEIKEKTWKN
jgi:hypothetical protein